MKVLVVEDDPDALDLLDHALAHFGYDVTRASSGDEALELSRRKRFSVVISDWEMPGTSGVELCRQIRQRQSSSYTYFVLLTSRGGTSNIVEGLRAGADEFLVKPFDPNELNVRLRVAERILALESRDVVIFSLARLAEARDRETGAHLERIRAYCDVLGQSLSEHPRLRDEVDADFVQLLYLTSPLHDIGKVGIPDSILLKPGPLTAEEFEIMKQHTIIGGETLDAAARAYPDARYLQIARDIALTHHEKYDGTGYPHGLAGERIPLCGRIVAIADVYDALTTPRVYKPAYSHDVARNIIVEGRGLHFDPSLVDSFLDNEWRFITVHQLFSQEDGASSAPSPVGALSGGTG